MQILIINLKNFACLHSASKTLINKQIFNDTIQILMS